MKKFLLFALILMLALCVAACDSTPDETPTEAPTEAVTEAPTEVPTEESTEAPTEAPTEEVTEAPTEALTEDTTEEVTEAPTEAPTEVPTEKVTEAPTEALTEEPTEEPTEESTEAPTEESTEAPTEVPADPVEPTAYYTAEQLAAMVPANATVTQEGDYAHFLTGTADTVTNPSITLTANEEPFSDIIAIKYRTNCGSYGSNFWGTFLLNGTAEFNGNRRDSDNWFYYATDGSWNVLILDMRKNKAGSEGTPDTDVTGGAAIESLVYNFFDYAGNDGKLTTADGGEEYFDIEYIAFFESKEDAQSFTEQNVG